MDPIETIREAIACHIMKDVEVVPVDKLPATVGYVCDPEGWQVYHFFRRSSLYLGGSEYLAYHPETSEIRFLGIHGE